MKKNLERGKQAAENIYIKKIEKEKLEKLARKGPTTEEAAARKPATSEVKPSEGPQSSSSYSSSGGVSTDKSRDNFFVAASAFGWWYFTRPKKTEDIAGLDNAETTYLWWYHIHHSETSPPQRMCIWQNHEALYREHMYRIVNMAKVRTTEQEL